VNTTKPILSTASIALLVLAAAAQEFANAEPTMDYSYRRYAPGAAHTKGHSLNGGGRSITNNMNPTLASKWIRKGPAATPPVSPFLRMRTFRAVPTTSRATRAPTCSAPRSKSGQTHSARLLPCYWMRRIPKCRETRSNRLAGRLPGHVVSRRRLRAIPLPWRFVAASTPQLPEPSPYVQPKEITC
jgi:hypothetical protein